MYHFMWLKVTLDRNALTEMIKA